MSERFLVTGAHGCLGAWTVAELVRQGTDVVAFDEMESASAPPIRESSATERRFAGRAHSDVR